ncbi:histone PARylation factor 1 [Thrips palmi]|uniref:Histone PARylation factor 1 n=1 Tax=Thrips palmi TaxID=161013 RepID=A0A6P8ZMD5_THRPL|nr:histone PARylation factor 1 [Thrips palmi]
MAGNDGPTLNCETIEEYQKDPRIACKYGAKCYQKNSVHINKYKHPPHVKDTKATKRRGAKRPNKVALPPQSDSDGPDDGHVSDAASGTGSPKRKAPKLKAASDNEEDQSGAGPSQDAASTVTVDVHSFDSEPELPPSPSDIKQSIKQKFLVEMPEDFYLFWDFCESVNGSNPALAFKDLGLRLVGPFDVLSSHFKLDSSQRKQSLFLLHWRYYYDPPGFQTVLKGDDTKQFHIGYFRDDPKSMPAFLASNCAAKDGVFTQVAENIFGAVNAYLNDLKKASNPFLQSKIARLQKSLQDYAKGSDITLDTKTQAMRLRDRKSVSKTFNGLGLVVPVEKRTEIGYRELIETDVNLKRILKRIAEAERQDVKDKGLDQLQQVITAANIANDECDFGTSVELGLDLFAFGGPEFDQSALQLLTTGYTLLGRPEFAKIARVHINNRQKGVKLDMFSS